MGDGAAESTGNGESGVEGSAGELLGRLSLDVGNNCLDGRGHCECVFVKEGWSGEDVKFSGPEKTD